jgi:4-amino-4-deoxy-L-arabinose transferase-like glycosyltransferase
VNGYDAYSLLITGRDHHGHPFPFAGLESFGDWVSPLLTFLTIPAVALFGLRIEALRAVTAGIGVLAIPIIYSLAIELFKRRSIGVLAAWYLALSPWHVHHAHFAIPPSIVPTMVLLTMAVLVWTVNHYSARGSVAVGLVAGLTIATYPTMKLFIPFLLAAGLIIYGRTILRLNREALLYAVIIFTLIAGPILYLSLRDPGGRARLDQISIFRLDWTPGLITKQYVSYFSPGVFFLRGNGHPAQTATPPGFGVELRAALPFLIAGAGWLIAMVVQPLQFGDRRSALFLLAALAIYPFPGSITIPNPPEANPHLARAVHLIPLLALITAVGVVAVFELAKHALRNAPASITRIVLSFAALIIVAVTGRELFVRYDYYYHQYAHRQKVLRYFQYGLQEALDYALAHAPEYDEVWVTEANQPYIYILFLSQWPPSDVHHQLEVMRNPPNFNEVINIGKYYFSNVSKENLDETTRVHLVRDLNGKKVYELRSGETADHRRVLLVSEP